MSGAGGDPIISVVPAAFRCECAARSGAECFIVEATMPHLDRSALRARLIRAGLYVVTDDRHPPEERLRIVDLALAAGARVVQLRDKRSPGRALLKEALALRELCERYDALLIVNDRVDVARGAEAHGVHVGQDDLPVEVARAILGDDALVGVSASYVEEAVAAELAGADYVGFGAMYATDTKPDAEFAGPALLRTVRQRVKLPLVAIGGITLDRVPEVMAAGADLVAVVSAVFGSPDPAEATRRLLATIEASRVRETLS